MSDLVFSSPAKREKFLRSMVKFKALVALKQADLFAPLPDENGAAKVVTTPTVPGQVAGLPLYTDCLGYVVQVGDTVLDICSESAIVLSLEKNGRVKLSSGWVPFASTLRVVSPCHG